MRERFFERFSDEQIEDLACAIQSAAGEGVIVGEELVSALADEFSHRGRQVPGPYSREWQFSPDEFIEYARGG